MVEPIKKAVGSIADGARQWGVMRWIEKHGLATVLLVLLAFWGKDCGAWIGTQLLKPIVDQYVVMQDDLRGAVKASVEIQRDHVHALNRLADLQREQNAILKALTRERDCEPAEAADASGAGCGGLPDGAHNPDGRGSISAGHSARRIGPWARACAALDRSVSHAAALNLGPMRALGGLPPLRFLPGPVGVPRGPSEGVNRARVA